MNITRYKWPVIIAAGLHGALFVSFPPEPLRALATVEKPAALPPLPPIPADLTPPVEDNDPGSTAGGAPVAGLPDELMPPDIKSPFEIPPVPRTPPERPVHDLKDFRGDIGDDIFSPGTIRVPAIPHAARLDRAPRTMSQTTPRYPAALRTDGIAGEAVVEFVVGTDGRVLTAEAVKWTHREFASAAVDAVLRWRFEPGTIDGRKVRFRMSLPVHFSVDR